MRSTIKVLVVDDSALVRQLLTRALSLDPKIEIVGIAGTGVEAIEKARELEPDVITLDIEMPELTGIEALPHLQKHCPARVVMLSSIDDADTTYQALSLGAVDFLPKPKAGMATSIGELAEMLLKKIKLAYRMDPHTVETFVSEVHEAEEMEDETPKPVAKPPTAARLERLVAVAASTGGPPALERVFSGLMRSLPAAYLVVQHLPAGFSASLARRLASASDITVSEAQEGMRIDPGYAYVAPHGAHMIVRRENGGVGTIHLEQAAPVHGVCPAADPLFRSVAESYGEKSVGVLLTGMGADGALGLRAIKDAGGETIAQDERTSVVWGMPGAAARLGVVRHTVPVGLVAAEIRRAVRGAVV